MPTQKQYKDFEKAFNRIRSANRKERLDAVGTLTPSLLRKHLKSGQDLVLAYGRKGATVTFNPRDLQSFADAIDRQKRRNRGGKEGLAGVPLLKLEKASWRDDKLRVRQIRNATLYRFFKNTLHFQVSASGQNSASHYQVRVRLEEFYDYMTDPRASHLTARDAAVGRISFDCSCGRHQYWFRYLATIGGYALNPQEKDYPKLRNPRLGGACCKHMLKVTQQLKSPSVQRMIAKEMERQANSAGYADQNASKFLNAKELSKMKRARGSQTDNKAAKRAYEDFKKAKTAFARKMQEKKMRKKVKALQAKDKANKARIKRLEDKAAKQAEQAKVDRIIAKLSGELNVAKRYKIPREDVITDFAKENDMETGDVNAIVEEYNL